MSRDDKPAVDALNAPAAPPHKISVCILNYRRPSLLRRLILPAHAMLAMLATLERYALKDAQDAPLARSSSRATTPSMSLIMRARSVASLIAATTARLTAWVR